MDATPRRGTGEKFLYLYIVLYAFSPIIMNYTAKRMPPILFAGVGTFLGGVALFFLLLVTGQLRHHISRKTFFLIMGNTVFNIIIPFLFIFVGTRMTSSINTALLHQTELIFAFFFCGLFFGEVITRQKILGGLTIIVGATFVLFNGTLNLNAGDLMIIVGTAMYPLGNQCSKIALREVSPAIILFFRCFVGGGVLWLLSAMFETYPEPMVALVRENLLFILIFGIVMTGFVKLLWFEGLKRLDISKATSIVIAQPAFSFLFAVLLLKEIPTGFQIAGFFVILAGLYILSRQKTEVIVET